MKLLTRTSIYYVIITLIVFTFGSWIFYSFLTREVEEETTESLLVKKHSVLTALKTKNAIPENSLLAEDAFIRMVQVPVAERIHDTLIKEGLEAEYQPYRVLTFGYEKNSQSYSITVRKMMIESDDLIESIFISFLLVLVLLAVTVLVTMQLLSRKIWKPFMQTLAQVKAFAPGEKKPLIMPATDITEFRELNAAILEMKKNTEDAFLSLKSFSENAAHELQTPLAIITSSAEVLLQDQKLTEEQYRSVSEMQATARRLSALTSTLLLLTKIENKQFTTTESVDFSDVVKRKINLLQELFDQKKLKVNTDLETNIQVKMHATLAEIIVANLLVNALRHTPEAGEISISVTAQSFLISNSGVPLKGNSGRIFERFYKEDQSEASTGLGLSLVKLAAENSGCRINYFYRADKHNFILEFPSKIPTE